MRSRGLNRVETRIEATRIERGGAGARGGSGQKGHGRETRTAVAAWYRECLAGVLGREAAADHECRVVTNIWSLYAYIYIYIYYYRYIHITI
jgi:hypothetical protein